MALPTPCPLRLDCEGVILRHENGVPAGLLLSAQFPINYFSISEVEQNFPDFQAAWEGHGIQLPGDGKFWRFNKIHNYGSSDEDPKNLPQRVFETS